MRIDVDALFDEFLDDFISKNLDKYSATEIEKKIEELYESFGNMKNDSLGGLTPIEYFAQMKTEELLSLLKTQVDDGESVSGYLCNVLEKRIDAQDGLIDMAFSTNEELAVYAINILGVLKSVKAFKQFIKAINLKNVSHSIADVMTEAMQGSADLIKEDILAVYKPNCTGADYFEDILSNASQDERIFKILCAEFLNDANNVSINAFYLAKYGDERALPILYSTIKRRDISLVDYGELKNAIEKLGGVVEDDGRFEKGISH